MAALAANTSLVVGGRYLSRPSPKSLIVKSASVVYQGSLCGIEHATGNVVPLDDAADRSYCGMSLNKITGSASLEEASINGLEFHADNVNVTGLTAQTVVPQPVYATTDNTLTMTRPSDDAVVVGIATKYASSGVGSVLFFGHGTAAAMGIAGGSKQRLNLAFHTFATFTNAYDLRFTLWGHGLIKEFGVMPAIIASASSKACTLTGSLGTTAITTGAISLTTVGLATAGTPQKVNPTAANEFHDGDVFKAVGSATTAFTEGSGYVYLDIEYLP